MNHILKDKEALISCIQEFKASQQLKQKQIELYEVKIAY